MNGLSFRKTVFHILGYEEKQTELANDLKKFKEEVSHNFDLIKS